MILYAWLPLASPTNQVPGPGVRDYVRSGGSVAPNQVLVSLYKVEPGASWAHKGHHRSARGTTSLTGVLHNRQGHLRPSRDTTDSPGAPQALQRHHRWPSGTRHSRDTTDILGAPQACQDTTGLSRALHLQSTFHRPSRGTTGLLEAPIVCQGTDTMGLTGSGTTGLDSGCNRTARGTDTSSLPQTPWVCQGHQRLVRASGLRSTITTDMPG